MLRSIKVEALKPRDGYMNWDQIVGDLTIRTLIALARTRARQNERSAAESYIQQARKIADREIDGRTRSDYQGQVVQALVDIGATEEASELVDAIGKSSDPERCWVIGSMANALAVSGRYAEALKYARQALKSSNSSEYIYYFMLLISRVERKIGDRHTALETLRKARELHEMLHTAPIDPGPGKLPPRSKSLKEGDMLELATAFGQAGDIPGAIQLARSIEGKQPLYQALIRLARIQAKAGDLKGALQTAELILPLREEDLQWTHWHPKKAEAHGEILAAQAGKGDLKGAFETADELIPWREMPAWVLVKMTEAYSNRNVTTGRPRRRPESSRLSW
jgi:tetratricopeptide (TPR) repeat protein